jgi:energy-converting hydrogenase Eha subunit F
MLVRAVLDLDILHKVSSSRMGKAWLEGKTPRKAAGQIPQQRLVIHKVGEYLTPIKWLTKQKTMH